MLIRISLIIALVAGLAVAGLNFFQVKQKVETLIKERNDWHGKYDVTFDDLTKTKGELEKTTAKLKSTEETLATTTAERDAAVAEADKQVKIAAELTEKLAAVTAERDDAQATVARYKQSGFEPEQLLTLAKQMKQLQDSLQVANEENKVLQHNIMKLENELAYLTEKEYQGPPLPATLRGKVLVMDPKYDFVVIDIGEEKGMMRHGELLVSRNGKLVGKVRVGEVQKDRSIANVVQGWSVGEIMEGDDVTPAHPAS